MARRPSERPRGRPFDAAQGRRRRESELRQALRRLARLDLRRTALGAFAIGVVLHACVAYAVLDDGTKEGVQPGIVETAPLPTATATPLADRRDCDAIRGTEYRSASERQWFLANCR